MTNQDTRLPLAISRLLRLILFGLMIFALASWCLHRSTAQSSAQSQPLSTTGFNTWTTNGPPNFQLITSLALDPTNAANVYATSDLRTYKSTNGGTTWSIIGLFGPISGAGTVGNGGITIARSSPNILYVPSPNQAFTASELYKTTDSGATWSPNILNVPITVQSIHGLAVSPIDPNTIYAATTEPNQNCQVWKTTSGGANWTATGLVFSSAVSIVIAPTNPNIVYAGLYDNFVNGVYKSVNGGPFTPTNLAQHRVYALTVDPTDPNIVYAGPNNAGVYKSIDGGASWTAMNNGLTNMFVYAISVDPSNTSIVYAGTNGGGVFKSTNGGASWIPFNNGLSSLQVAAFAVDGTGKNLHTGAAGVFDYKYAALFSITGQVRDVNGSAMVGTTVTLSGSASGSTTTDNAGNYSFANVTEGGNYTVTPSGAGFSFSPANQAFNALSVDRIANFVGTRTLISITGNVTDANNVALNNVIIALTKNGVAAGTTATNVLGNYSFANQTAGANYVVTPTGSFTPSSQTLGNLTTNATVNFKAAPSIPSQCNTVSFGRTDFVAGSGPRYVAIGDFNGDGKGDLAVANINSNDVSILLATASMSFGAATNFAVGSRPELLAIGDFNGDGTSDLAVTNTTSNNVSILLGNGIGTFGAATNFTVGTGPRGVAIGDFNGDGKSDLAIANINSNNISILLGTGTGSFGAATNFGAGSGPRGIAIGDFNGDGKSDLAVTNTTSNNVSVLLGTGTGSFGTATNFAAGSSPQEVVIGDLNSDGKSDLAVANFSSNNISILLGTGTGSFGGATNFGVASGPREIAIGDLNGDGKSDVAVPNNGSNNVSILLGTGTGSFTAATNLAVGTGPFSLALSDLNSDGKNDLAVANEGTNNVSILLNNGATCNAQTTLTISGRIAAVTNNPLSDVTVTVSGPITRVKQTDANGDYAFSNLAPGGNYAVTIQSTYFVFAPSRADFFNLGSSQTADFTAAPLAVPLPTPPLSDNFTTATRDPNKWSLGTQTQPAAAVDPRVTVVQAGGQLVITPISQASGLHFNGYVSSNSFDMRNGSVGIELVKAATGGADTNFAMGTDVENFFRFMVHTPRSGASSPMMITGIDGVDTPLDESVAQLLFQVSIAGQLTTLPIPYDPVAHHYMRFRAETPLTSPPTGAILFETSPDNTNFTVQLRRALDTPKQLAALVTELSAGTTNPSNPGFAAFDNVNFVSSTFQFSAGSYVVGEGDGSTLITVTRSGSTADSAAVDFATLDGTARQKTRYTNTAGTLTFAAGVASRTFRVLLVDNQLAEGEQTLSLLLSNPAEAGLNSPGRALLTITDNDTALATTNSLDDARYFVTQHYYDFLSRVPDQSGLDFWVGQITLCGTDEACLRTQRITVSNAFFYEQEYQQTGSYVVRLYRAAYGNNQPISNNDANPQFPNENKKLVNYSAFSPDRARVRGGPSLAQTQLDLANAFVLRPQFLAKYPASLDGPAFVDAILATINNDIGVNLSSQRSALLDLFNQGGRGKVLYRLADDNANNPIANQAFLDAEYNRAFVLTQYFGYLRRNPDVGGFVFWLGQVNSAPLRALEKQRAMVCSFITSAEYQQRFSTVVTHNNTECQ